MVLTAKPCRASGVPYLLAIPAGFGLFTVAFAAQTLQPFIASGSPLGLPIGVVWLLTQTYGMLFLAFAYARRTGLRFLGESTILVLVAAATVTVMVFVLIFLSLTFGDADVVPLNTELFLRTVIIAGTLYLMYETLRSWSLTHRASEGFVTIGFAFFLAEQLGFILVLANLGSSATFLAYEGRTLGLFVINAVLIVGVRRGDLLVVLKRLGLGAPAHERASPLIMQQEQRLGLDL